MTPAEQLKEKNQMFILQTLEDLGFGKIFHEDARKAMAEGARTWTAKASTPWDERTKEIITIEPVISEHKPDFYILDGYKATRSGPDLKTTSQFFDVFKKTGFSLAEARELLRGGTVLNTVQNENGKYQRYTSINFDKPRGDNFELQHTRIRNAQDYDLVKILSQMKVVATPEQKEEYLQRLNRGEQVAMTVKPDGIPVKVMVEAAPHEKAVRQISADGELTLFRSNVVREMRLVNEEGSKATQSQTEPSQNAALAKAAELAQTGNKNKPTHKNQRVTS